MEPQLISRKAIKKILKKKYTVGDNFLNKSFNSIIDKIKINWLPIIIILFAILLLIHLYIEHKNKKIAEKMEQDTLLKMDKKYKEDFETNEDDFKAKPNYESEYYKMLPRITSQPEVIPYMY